MMNEQPPSIECPVCHLVSYHPDDVWWGYCGKCHNYTSRSVAERWMLGIPDRLNESEGADNG